MNPEKLEKSKVAADINTRQLFLRRMREPGVSVEEVAKIVGKHHSTLYRMKKRAEAGETLIDRRLISTGMPSKVDDMRAGWALAFLSSRQGASLSLACRELNKVAEANGWPETNYYGLYRYIEKMPSDLRQLLAEGSKSMLLKSMPVGRRENYRLLELVQGDFTELPIWTLDLANGKIFKPYMTGVIEAASRVVMGVKFHKSPPDAIEVVGTVRKAFLPKDDPAFPFWGVPEVFQSDNGGVFVGTQLTEAAQRTGFIVDPIAIGQPEENGKIERFFGTFSRGFLARLEGYADQSSGKAKAERGVIPYPVLERLAWNYLIEYSATVHSEINSTPWEKWHELVGASANRLFPRKHIADGMRVMLEADVTREGVSIDGRYYNGSCLNGFVKRKVSVLVTPQECDQTVPAYYKGKLLGTLRLATKVADEINSGRFPRAKRLIKFRKDMAGKLDELPQVNHPETVKPKEAQKVARANRDKKAKAGKSLKLKREIC